MNKHLLVFAAAAFVAVGCQTENNLSMTAKFDDMPPNVQSVVKQEIGDAEIMDIDVERRTGSRVYEITYMEGGAQQKLHVRGDGAVLSAQDAALFGWGSDDAELHASTEEMTVRTEAAGAERPANWDKSRGTSAEYKSNTGATGASVSTSDHSASVQSSTSSRDASFQANARGTQADADLQLGTKFGDVPAAVQQTIQREAAGAQIADIDKETRTGRTVYEVSFREPGKNPKLHIAQDGTLLTEQQASAFRDGADFRSEAEYRGGRDRIEAKREVRGGAQSLTEGPSANADLDVDVDADSASIDADADLSRDPAGAESRVQLEASGAEKGTRTGMRLESLPENIQSAVRQHGGGADVSSIRKTTVYEVQFKDASKGTLRIAQDGTVLSGSK